MLMPLLQNGTATQKRDTVYKVGCLELNEETEC
jgi:hypothetical protein